ncbi:Shikimate kinase [uncultured delta proteobacterium]|uniref:Shikimate kinase n=1 Tax=uncultured delta proteobacterium TaxID=34034 RepID=A0A212IVJ5_9DELT|nr:Shikimate kinase [uncultured delta proteobacterium]
MGILFLIGPRGSGKTLMASILAQKHGCRTCDTDALIREKTGKSVADIVAEGGWPAFRALEKAALAEAVARMREGGGPAVIATGGGIVLDPENRERMRAEGVVAYLAAPPNVLARRLPPPQNDPSRPSLTNLPPEQEIARVLQEREPLYRAAAHHVVDAARPPESVAAILRGHIMAHATVHAKGGRDQGAV